MFLLLRFNCTVLIFFHLLSHAGFKFLLFLRVGNLINSSFSLQDFRGGSFILFEHKLISSFCIFGILGLFFVSGAISKEIIINTIFLSKNSFLLLVLIEFSVCFTFYYSLILFRTVYLTKVIKIVKYKIFIAYWFKSVVLFFISIIGLIILFWRFFFRKFFGVLLFCLAVVLTAGARFFFKKTNIYLSVCTNRPTNIIFVFFQKLLI